MPIAVIIAAAVAKRDSKIRLGPRAGFGGVFVCVVGETPGEGDGLVREGEEG